MQGSLARWLRLFAALLACGAVMRPSAGQGEPAALASANAAAAAVLEASVKPKLPTAWLPAHGNECAGSGRRKGFCQGPRKVPMPYGEAAKLATGLGLGTVDAAGDLMIGPPRPDWVEAAGERRDETLLWPVEEGLVWRGLQEPQKVKHKIVHPRHKGVDIGAPEGSLIRAVKSGVVAYSDNGVHGYGNLLVAIHTDGSVAMYGHCKAIYVFPGQLIERGQVVAEVGHTGVARGSHLHFEYRERGQLKDPIPKFVPAARYPTQ